MSASVSALRATLLILLVSALLGGCSWFGATDKKGRYGQDALGRDLEIPPDLTAPEYDQAYEVPGREGTVTATATAMAESGAQGAALSTVVPNYQNLVVHHDGVRRWLELNITPENLWPKLQGFWVAQDMVLQLNKPQLGVMETEWMEELNAPKKSFLSRIFGTAFNTQSGKDRLNLFRIRIERLEEGTTGVYLTHRALEKYLVNDEELHWKSIPYDPELEAQMLRRLIVYLGRGEDEARQLLAQPETQAVKTTLTEVDGRKVLEVEDGYNRTWRRVGIALDHIGMLIEDRNRAQGIYYVTYTGKERQDKPGFFERVFGVGEGPVPLNRKFQIHVSDEGNGRVEISAQNEDGEPLKPEAAEQIVTSLQAHLK